MPKDETAAQDAGAPAAAAEAPVVAAPSAAAGDDSTASGAGAEHPVEAVVRKWVGEHFYNSPVSRSTEAFNYLNQTAVPALVSSLKEIY